MQSPQVLAVDEDAFSSQVKLNWCYDIRITQARKAPSVEERMALLQSARGGLVASDAAISPLGGDAFTRPLRNDAVNACKLAPVMTGS